MRITHFNRNLRRAFTLTEMLISASLLTLVVAGVVAGHLTGMKMVQITKAKLGASDEARKAVSRLTDEVRGAKWLLVGSGNATSFDPADEGEKQEGSAVEIYSTSGTNAFVRYYLDARERALKRIASGEQKPTVIATALTNTTVFAFENSAGEVLTGSENNRVLSVALQFYQIQYPVVKVGPGEFYDYYQLRTRITRRTLE